MKTCPACGATYTARISFCFEDGAVLVAASSAHAPTQGARPPRVPSRVATPVSPARRGRSLLSQKGAGLSFSPPRATATRSSDTPVGPAPLQPLPVSLDETADDLLADLPIPTLDNQEPSRTPTPAPAPVRHTATPTPAPLAEDRVVPGKPNAAERTFDDLDFFDGAPSPSFEDDGLFEDEDDDRAALPPWLLPVAGVVAVLLLMGVVFLGAVTLGLVGTKRAMEPKVDPDPTTVSAPVPPPAPAPAPVPVVDAPSEDPIGGQDPTPIDDPSTPDEPIVDAADPIVDAADPIPAPEPAPAPAPVPAPSPAPAPAPAVGPAPAPVVAPAPTPSGSPWGSLDALEASVSITSTPAGARISLDGAPVGTTPLETRLAHGDYLLAISMAGYQSVERVVAVRGEAVAFPHDLKPEARSASFIVVLEGAVGAMLYVNGTRSGPLPARVTLSDGTHEFRVESPSGTITVTREVDTSAEAKIIDLRG